MKNILLVFSGMVIMYVICLGNSTKELKDYTEQISEITSAKIKKMHTDSTLLLA